MIKARNNILSNLLIVVSLLMGCGTGPEITSKRKLVRPEDPMVALVNGQGVKQSRLSEVLLNGYGRKVLDELVLLEVVRQAAAKKGLTVTPAEVQAEFEGILEDMAEGKSRREKTALLEYMLQSRHLSRAEFDLIVERQALLSRMVDPNVTITEQMLKEEYERQYGRKVLVREIVRSSFRSIQEPVKLLEAGADFKEMAEKFSEDQVSLARGGLVGPFSRADEHIPVKVREEAFKLNKIGQQSKVFSYYDGDNLQWWCVLQLEKDFPAVNVPIEEVKEKLRQIIQRRVRNQRTMGLLEKLRGQATVTIFKQELKTKQ